MIKTGLSRLGIFFLFLLSLLPFWFLYLLADLLFIIIYYIIGYRRKIVEDNLRNSFPEKSLQELNSIERKYFKYLADLIVEIIKTISISAKDVEKRMRPTNPGLMEDYFTQGKSIIAAAGHYCNWEMATLSFGLLTGKKRFIVYRAQSNVVFTDFFNRVRSRFGSTMISTRQALRKMIEFKNELTFSVLVADQTPTKVEARYFTTFLNQPTAIFLGLEKLTRVVDCVVIFFRIDRVKRGYYTYTFVPLIENPHEAQLHEITEAHVRYLENVIKQAPEYWIWSHRRWKFKPGEDKT